MILTPKTVVNYVIKLSNLRSVLLSQPFNTITTSIACMKSHYESLGVPRNATQADIKAAYYKLSLIYHPDRNDTTEASESFREITEAYEVIGNLKLRKMYDKGLLGHMASDDGDSRRTYTNYNTRSSEFKNKPTFHNKSHIYNFDAWSQFHYGDALNRRNEAKARYEDKTHKMSRRNNEAKNENVIVIIFSCTVLIFFATYTFNYRDSLDKPPLIKKE